VEAFPRDRRLELRRFDELLARCERLRPAGLPFDELRELGRLYRRQLSLLARLRERDDDPEAIRYLNALCVRAYAHLSVSSAPRGGGLPPLLSRTPAALARTWRALALAWVLLLLGIYVGAALVARDPQAVHALVPDSLGYTPTVLDGLISSPEARRDFLEREATPVGFNLLFGSQLFANNTRVGLLAFATGILAGIPTVLLALYNGVTVGALGAVFFRDPIPSSFLAWILPHGIPELTAVTLCVAAGLMLGGAVASPGRAGRRAALGSAAESALLLFAASIPLFLVAALIESFVRESALGTASRLGIAAAVTVVLVGVAGALKWLTRGPAPDASWVAELSARDRTEVPDSGSAPAP
jgi:uncharacterized membrane protein SpoIIM required for sporulation